MTSEWLGDANKQQQQAWKWSKMAIQQLSSIRIFIINSGIPS